MFGNETNLPENFPSKAQMEYEKEIAQIDSEQSKLLRILTDKNLQRVYINEEILKNYPQLLRLSDMLNRTYIKTQSFLDLVTGKESNYLFCNNGIEDIQHDCDHIANTFEGFQISIDSTSETCKKAMKQLCQIEDSFEEDLDFQARKNKLRQNIELGEKVMLELEGLSRRLEELQIQESDNNREDSFEQLNRLQLLKQEIEIGSLSAKTLEQKLQKQTNQKNVQTGISSTQIKAVLVELERILRNKVQNANDLIAQNKNSTFQKNAARKLKKKEINLDLDALEDTDLNFDEETAKITCKSAEFYHLDNSHSDYQQAIPKINVQYQLDKLQEPLYCPRKGVIDLRLDSSLPSLSFLLAPDSLDSDSENETDSRKCDFSKVFVQCESGTELPLPDCRQQRLNVGNEIEKRIERFARNTSRLPSLAQAQARFNALKANCFNRPVNLVPATTLIQEKFAEIPSNNPQLTLNFQNNLPFQPLLTPATIQLLNNNKNEKETAISVVSITPTPMQVPPSAKPFKLTVSEVPSLAPVPISLAANSLFLGSQIRRNFTLDEDSFIANPLDSSVEKDNESDNEEEEEEDKKENPQTIPLNSLQANDKKIQAQDSQHMQYQRHQQEQIQPKSINQDDSTAIQAKQHILDQSALLFNSKNVKEQVLFPKNTSFLQATEQQPQIHQSIQLTNSIITPSKSESVVQTDDTLHSKLNLQDAPPNNPIKNNSFSTKNTLEIPNDYNQFTTTTSIPQSKVSGYSSSYTQGSSVASQSSLFLTSANINKLQQSSPLLDQIINSLISLNVTDSLFQNPSQQNTSTFSSKDPVNLFQGKESTLISENQPGNRTQNADEVLNYQNKQKNRYSIDKDKKFKAGDMDLFQINESKNMFSLGDSANPEKEEVEESRKKKTNKCRKEPQEQIQQWQNQNHIEYNEGYQNSFNSVNLQTKQSKFQDKRAGLNQISQFQDPSKQQNQLQNNNNPLQQFLSAPQNLLNSQNPASFSLRGIGFGAQNNSLITSLFGTQSTLQNQSVSLNSMFPSNSSSSNSSSNLFGFSTKKNS